MDEWCKQRDFVWEDKIHRCSLCGRRLKPQETNDFHLILPRHKKKGYKIKRKKGHNNRKEKPYRRNG